MLETLVTIIVVLGIFGLVVFGLAMLDYIFSGDYEIDQRIDYWGR